MVTRLAFIDWLKAIGIFLIVFGHVGAGHLNRLTPPVYPKQWGVAFVLFATAFTLARETRPRWRVVFNRLFEIVLVTTAFSVVTTIISLAMGGRGQLSNFWPLLLGVNVVVDAFPANPTTWFIGTYIHVILLWAPCVRILRPSPGWIIAGAAFEIVTRALLWTHAGSYVAYMVLPNWLTVLLLGTYASQARQPPSRGVAVAAAALAVAPIALALAWPFDTGFPFRALAGTPVSSSHFIASAGVTASYAGVTGIAYVIGSRLPSWGVVRFLARHTIFVFVAHMPLFYLLSAWTVGWPRPLRVVLFVAACQIGLALAGAAIYKVVEPMVWRERIGNAIARWIEGSSSAVPPARRSA